MAKNYKRIKRLQTVVNTDKETAVKIDAIMSGDIDPETCEAVEAWIVQCYNRPHNRELQMCAINKLLNGFGCEAVRCEEWLDSYHCDIRAVYVNMGDTYAGTVILDHKTDRYYVTTLGDWVEMPGVTVL